METDRVMVILNKSRSMESKPLAVSAESPAPALSYCGVKGLLT
jgi:hypothetical protein